MTCKLKVIISLKLSSAKKTEQESANNARLCLQSKEVIEVWLLIVVAKQLEIILENWWSHLITIIEFLSIHVYMYFQYTYLYILDVFYNNNFWYIYIVLQKAIIRIFPLQKIKHRQKRIAEWLQGFMLITWINVKVFLKCFVSLHQLACGDKCIKWWNRDWEMLVVDNACKYLLF